MAPNQKLIQKKNQLASDIKINSENLKFMLMTSNFLDLSALDKTTDWPED